MSDAADDLEYETWRDSLPRHDPYVVWLKGTPKPKREPTHKRAIKTVRPKQETPHD